MITSCGSMDLYTNAEMGYRRDRIQRDFAAINWAAQQRAERRARAAEARAAGLTPTAEPGRRTWIVRWHRTPHPAAR